jgi:hypothetical protein
MFRLLMALAFFVFLSGHAFSAEEKYGGSIQDLYTQCKSSDSEIRILCISYIAGVMETMELVGGDGTTTSQQFGICTTDFVSFGAGVQVFINWAEKHPKAWNDARNFGVIMALRGAWPCETPKKK